MTWFEIAQSIADAFRIGEALEYMLPTPNPGLEEELFFHIWNLEG